MSKYALSSMLTAVLAVQFASCTSKTTRTPALNREKDVPASSPLFDPAAMDTGVSPCDDFYEYACGTWIKNFQLPSDRSAYTRQSSSLDDDAEKIIYDGLQKLDDQFKQGNLKDTDLRLASYYASCMDTAANAATQKTVLDAKLALLSELKSDTIATTVAKLHASGVNILFSFGSWIDTRNSTQVGAGVDIGGFALPNKDYYLSSSDDQVATRKEYVSHIAQVFAISGEPAAQAATDAQAVLAIETRLAEKTISLDDIGAHPELTVHVTPIAELEKTTAFDWKAYFKAVGAPDFAQLNVAQPDALAAAYSVLTETPVDQLRAYFKWQILHAAARYAAGDLEQENFRFWSNYLNGQPTEPARWKTCVQAAERDLPEAVGRIFVAHYPDADAIRARVRDLMSRIEENFGKNAQGVGWIDADTKARIAEKLQKTVTNVGFPQNWKTYDGFDVSSSSYVSNAFALGAYSFQSTLGKIGKPNDRHQWEMGVWEANAYYSRENNSMNFPLGSLIPPIFDVNADDGLNYGSFGASWVGHELTHGFDAGGRKYDGDGNLTDSWSQASAATFDQRMNCFIDQANQYEVLPGLHVNGKATITENFADQGGMKIGWAAYREAAQGRPAAAPIAGFNEDQQFFLAYAQGWCTKRTDQSLRQVVLTDEHPPEQFRVNGVVMNMPAFADAFGCKASSRMTPTNRCTAW